MSDNQGVEGTGITGSPGDPSTGTSSGAADAAPAGSRTQQNTSWGLNFGGFDGAAPTFIMKGGTTSAAYDQFIKRKEVDAERRRDHQDLHRKLIEEDVDAGFGVGGFHENKLVSQDSPKLVFQYLNRDGTIHQECISEITIYPDPLGDLTDMLFTLVCPRCQSRGLPSSECQVLIRSSHRKWWLDEKKRGLVLVETPWGPQMVFQAGTVTVQDAVKCSNFNCDWKVRIDDSKVRGA